MAGTGRRHSIPGMRKLGIGVLGLFSGLLPGFASPVLGIIGVFAALAIDAKVHHGRSE